MSDDAYSLKVEGLDKLVKALKRPPPQIKIGVLGDTATRSQAGGGPNNATIGMFAEFGTANAPARSWLRKPLIDHLPKALEGVLDKATATECVKAGSLLPWANKVGVIAEGVVLEGFATGGYGEWPPSNMAYKTNHQTLIESGQLRNAVTHSVTERG